MALVQRALAEDPDNPAYLDSLGWAYYKQNKLADAEHICVRPCSGESTDPTMLSHLGDVLAKNGQADLAADGMGKIARAMASRPAGGF